MCVCVCERVCVSGLGLTQPAAHGLPRVVFSASRIPPVDSSGLTRDIYMFIYICVGVSVCVYRV